MHLKLTRLYFPRGDFSGVWKQVFVKLELSQSLVSLKARPYLCLRLLHQTDAELSHTTALRNTFIKAEECHMGASSSLQFSPHAVTHLLGSKMFSFVYKQ